MGGLSGDLTGVCAAQTAERSDDPGPWSAVRDVDADPCAAYETGPRVRCDVRPDLLR